MSNRYPDPESGDRRRHPILSVLMGIVGLILLLPGLCSVIFILFVVAPNPKQLFDSGTLRYFVPLWVVCFAITAVGIFLIRRSQRED
jgi:hypothetical protein